MSSLTPTIKKDHGVSPAPQGRANQLTLPIYLSYFLSLIVVAFVTYHFASTQSWWVVVACSAFMGSGGYVLLRRSLFSFQGVLIRSAEHLIQKKKQEFDAEKERFAEEGTLRAEREAKATLSPEDQERIETLEKSFLGLKEKYTKIKEEFEGLTYQKESLERELQDSQQKLKAAQEHETRIVEEKNKITSDLGKTQHLHKAEIAQLDQIVKQKQARIERLENKVLDLKYEVKTLLELESMNHASLSHDKTKRPRKNGQVLRTEDDLGHLEEADLEELYNDLPISSDPSLHSQYDRFMQLKRCVNIAKKIRGAQTLKEQSRFQGMGVDRYLIDLRRLFENLKRESSGIVFLYSKKEGRILFANHEVKGALGWTPEKFVKDFSKIVQHGFQDWSQAVTTTKQSQGPLELVVRTKEGEPQKVSCYLANVPEGAFADDVIGILYPAA